MNGMTNTTNGAVSPRPLNLQLLDLGDKLNLAYRFAQAIEMAAHALDDEDQRAPMLEIVNVLVERLRDLKDKLDDVREELA